MSEPNDFLVKAIVKAQNREGYWFELETDEGLDEAISAANGLTVHLFYVLSEVYFVLVYIPCKIQWSLI